MIITSLNDIYPIIESIQLFRFGRTHMENYRGHSLREYKLIPGLGRYEFNDDELVYKEKCLYNNFLSRLEERKIDAIRRPFKEVQNFELKNFWYTLFQSQHLGLRTRLMDWSINFETALLFAVEEEKYHGKDGSLWVFFCPQGNLVDRDNVNELMSINPFDFKGDVMINSPLFLYDDIFELIGENRMGRQFGRFWVQSAEKFRQPLDRQEEFSPFLKEYIIDGNSKADIKKELTDKGLTIDWQYYRKDLNIDSNISEINKLCLG